MKRLDNIPLQESSDQLKSETSIHEENMREPSSPVCYIESDEVREEYWDEVATKLKKERNDT